MKWLLALWLTVPLLAQTPSASSSAASPTPSGELTLTGTLDIGYRFTSLGGSSDVYDSIVNLQQGPRLLGLDFTLTDPKKRRGRAPSCPMA